MDWTIFATLSAFAIAIIGANYKFTKDIKDDLKTDMHRFESKFDAKIEKSDERWESLLKELHSHDKRIDRIEQK